MLLQEPVTSEPLIKLGKIELYRPDKMNWTVTGDGRTRYYPSLPQALMVMARVVADPKISKGVDAWLAAYSAAAKTLQQACYSQHSPVAAALKAGTKPTIPARKGPVKKAVAKRAK